MTTTATYNKSAWLGNYPAHWQVLRIKNCASINQNTLTEQTGLDYQFNYLDIANVNSDGEVLEIQKMSFKDAPSRARRIVNKDDIVISTVRTYLKAIALIGNDFDNLIASTGFAVLKSKGNINPKYLYYALTSKDFIHKVMINSFGVTYPAITPTALNCLSIPVPPYQEQIQIANYLDTQTKKINHFIAKKQQFIALLKEQRQSVINEKLKINAKKIKIKYCVSKVGTGVTPTGGATVYKDSGIIFLRSQNVHNDGLRLDDVAYITEEIHSEMKGSQVQFDDVLVNVTGASIGRCFVFDKMEEANINQHVCILRPNQDVLLSEFLMLQIQSERIQTLINMIEGASREGLTNNELKNYYLFVPSLKDQKNIITEIKTETATIDTAIAKTEKEIELIKEYKEAMIAEAVMGKINFNKL